MGFVGFPQGGVAQTAASHDDHGSQAASPQSTDSIEVVPVYPNLGSRFREPDTGNAEARAYFNQGLRLTYSFGHPEALRAFRAARDLDPACAMCWWGEAWALGPYINAPNMSSVAEEEAFAAISRAMELREGAEPADRALIEAMALRYRDRWDDERPAVLDSTYADAMREVVRQFPHDLDAGSLLAESIMVLNPWNQWAPDGTPRPGTLEAVAVLESVLGRDLAHPGACHLYIHAMEASQEPERAAPCSDLLAAEIPGASHIQHMPSHIYMRIGRYGDAVRANQRAWHVDQQASHGGPPGIYPTHNLHMLSFAASMDGQGAVAIQAARDLARISPPSAIYIDLTLVRFGRWQEVLELPDAHAAPFNQGVRHFARGMALLRTGDPGAATGELEALRGTLEGVGEARFRRHSLASLLGLAEGILEGEIHAHQEEWEEAEAALVRAIAVEDGLTYDEPEPWFIPGRHVLGAIFLEAGKPLQAESTYREALEIHRDNGWSLFGLAQALRAQGRILEAEEAERRMDEVWARSDTWIRGSRF